ncbi:hypothetical protein P5673_022424, partial [Acropora cervicornis]
MVVEFSWLFTRVCAALEEQIPKVTVKFYDARSLSLIERSGNNLSILLLGDFNLSQIVWSTPSPTCPDSLWSTFCAVIADYFLHQLVLQLTREQNILDLVFITAPELVKDLEICQPVGGFDHCSIEFTLKLDWLGLREVVERNIPSKQLKLKKFWSFIKARTGNRSVASCIEYEGIRAYSPLNKANLVNSFVHADEGAKLLHSIDVNKASGPDNIPPRILKECAMELALPLTNFFNFTLSRGNIPTYW